MQVFAEVSRAGSFSRAAESMHLSQPALSQAITQLERAVGAPLFDRTTRALQLSSLGQQLLPRIEFILREVDVTFEQVASMRDLESGRVSVGCLASIAVHFLPPVLTAFATRHPKIEISVIDGNAADLRRRLLAGQIDLAVTAFAEADMDLEFQPLIDDPFCLICHPDHPLARATSLRWKDLSGHRYIGFALETSNRAAIDKALDAAGLKLTPQVELTQLGTVVGMVASGYGIATIPSLAGLDLGHLKIIPLHSPKVVRQVGLQKIAGRAQTFAASAFGDLLREMFQSIASPSSNRRG